MIKVMIADDHAIIHKGLQELFRDVGNISAAGMVSSGEELLKRLGDGSSVFDLLLLDISMPGLSGVELISRICALRPKLPILVLSVHDEPQIVRRVLHAGASGFVTKGSSEDILVAAIRRVAQGGRFVDSAIIEQVMFDPPLRHESAAHGRLSPRELQIMKSLARGRSLAEIAAECFISDKTVSTHKARLMLKMGFQSNAELVRYAIDHHLIE
ncbi:response regulator [Paludibacterium yongneupense]|uniref:response regulator n=1 Tax=Paludibacterium yongneupense TaxID=400061 RepID=UPI00048EA74F|nr:response regulator transcription factor [Paludibacterium yongneupense]